MKVLYFHTLAFKLDTSLLSIILYPTLPYSLRRADLQASTFFNGLFSQFNWILEFTEAQL